MRILSVLIGASLLAGVAGTASAEVYRYRTRGSAADFSTYTYTDCGYEGLWLSVFESMDASSPGTPMSYSGGYLDYYSYDFCTGASSYGWTYIDGANVDFNRLQSASVGFVAEMTLISYGIGGIGGMPACGGAAGAGGADGGMGEPTYEERVVPLSVSLEWTGTGETYRSRYSSSWSSPSGRSQYRSTGSSREAAVTGSIDVGDDSVDLSSGYANLSQSSDGSFEMYR